MAGASESFLLPRSRFRRRRSDSTLDGHSFVLHTITADIHVQVASNNVTTELGKRAPLGNGAAQSSLHRPLPRRKLVSGTSHFQQGCTHGQTPHVWHVEEIRNSNLTAREVLFALQLLLNHSKNTEGLIVFASVLVGISHEVKCIAQTCTLGMCIARRSIGDALLALLAWRVHRTISSS